RYRRYPERLLDINVSSDYGKIGRMLRVGDEKANWQLLEQLLEDGCAQAAPTVQFSFERS
ncbi:MAG: hypothetical protein NZM41_01775, partial [Saprospiraceae bacterium]|nr:hypothetical protein [Saprospiraceae bacterium]